MGAATTAATSVAGRGAAARTAGARCPGRRFLAYAALGGALLLPPLLPPPMPGRSASAHGFSPPVTAAAAGGASSAAMRRGGGRGGGGGGGGGGGLCRRMLQPPHPPSFAGALGPPSSSSSSSSSPSSSRINQRRGSFCRAPSTSTSSVLRSLAVLTADEEIRNGTEATTATPSPSALDSKVHPGRQSPPAGDRRTDGRGAAPPSQRSGGGGFHQRGEHGEAPIKLSGEVLNRWDGAVGGGAAVRAAARAELLHNSSGGRKTDSVPLNAVLGAWNRCAQALAERHRRAPPSPPPPPSSSSSASTEPEQQQRPPPAEWTGPAICTARDAAAHAEELLLRRVAEEGSSSSKEEEEGGGEEDNDDHAKVDVQSFNTVMDAWAKSGHEDAVDRIRSLMKVMKKKSGLQADILSYHALIDAYAVSNKPDRLEHLQGIYHKMLQQQDPSLRPTVRTVNSLLAAYSKQAWQQDADKAEECAAAAVELLHDLKQASDQQQQQQPDVTTYTAVMDCLARCGTLRAAKQAEQLFAELKELYHGTDKNERYRPSAHTYAALIKSWVHTRARQAPHRAEELLEELLERCGDGDPTAAPGARAFAAAIQCWAKSADPAKAARALQLLRRMRNLSRAHPEAAPSLQAYNAALEACVRTRGTEEQQLAALKIAFAIEKAMEKGAAVTPNHVTYTLLLKAAAFLLPAGEERNMIATAVFEKAVKRGQVDGGLLQAFRKAVDADIIVQKLPDGMVGKNGIIFFDRIPASWSKHVRT